MKSHISLHIIVLLIVSTMHATAQNDLPVPDRPADWVNDYANVFSSSEKAQLSRKLNVFQYETSTQIFVVTIDENDGYPASLLAPQIGEKWGVGQKGKENGLILLMDMKARDVFIATGYGLEEYIPDGITGRIIESEIIPAFKQGNYFEGVDKAPDVMISLLEVKFTPDEYSKQAESSDAGSAIGGIIFMIILFSILFGSRRRSYGAGGRRSNLPLWIALGMLSSGRSRGSFGNFSSGSGSFGGGGFGGFTGGGGGSFGGGGAGGSW